MQTHLKKNYFKLVSRVRQKWQYWVDFGKFVQILSKEEFSTKKVHPINLKTHGSLELHAKSQKNPINRFWEKRQKGHVQAHFDHIRLNFGPWLKKYSGFESS